MELASAQILWYIVFISCIFAYAALDGFDLGVGCLHLFANSDTDRRIFLNSIGPVWDSNSLWVVITGGALLAGFPDAFSVMFSSLYMPMMILIFCFTYRAVAIEFRSKMHSVKWRSLWDWVFALASYGMAFGLGVVTANLIHGLPIDQHGEFIKDISALFSPFAIIVGLFAIIVFMQHGSLYLTLKTSGMLHERLKRWNFRIFSFFVLFWIAVNLYTPFSERHVTNFPSVYCFVFTALLGALGMICLYRCLKKNFYGMAFVSSAVTILSLILLFALGTYPNIIRSSLNDAYSLTLFNSSSSLLTLEVLLGMACAGVPLFVLYVSYGYKVFRGKVELHSMSY